MAGRAAAAGNDPPYGATCPVVPQTTPDPGTFEHRWAGRIQDPFTLDGEEVWIGEDGGRIRRRDPVTGNWEFQPVPYEVRGTIRRIHFLPDGLNGWAVSSDGWVLNTTVAGSDWKAIARIPALPGTLAHPVHPEWEELWDIHFADNGLDGWLVGLHGILYTEDGGVCWQLADLFTGTVLIEGPLFVDWNIELYALDVQWGASVSPCGGGTPGTFLGLAVGQPGFVLRSMDLGRTWHMVLDITDAICPGPLPACLQPACGHFGGDPPWFEPWDVEIRDHPTDSLALVVGGVGANCGFAFSSTDGGCTWTRELHECEVAGSGVDCTTCEYTSEPCDPTAPVPARRLTSFRTLYGLGIFDAEGDAVAAGYNGQHLRREALTDGTGQPTGVSVWRDRSEFGLWTDAPLAVTIFPLFGATVPDHPIVPGRAWMTGVGGQVRVSDDWGETWEHEPGLTGHPFRISAAWFKSVPGEEDTGWQVGQFFRLAMSTDGGRTWNPSTPPRIFPGSATYHDVTFAGNGDNGVAVGSFIPDGPDPDELNEGPRIVWTDDFGATAGWREVPPANIDYVPESQEEEHFNSSLFAVCWAKDAANLQFWAVGQRGLVLRSLDRGETWTQLTLPVANPHTVTLRGVAAAGPNAIVAVGVRPGGLNPGGRAFRYQGSTWSEIPIQTSPPGSITLLSAVAAQGTQVYAVGRREIGSVRTGVVLKYNATTQVFEDFPGPYAPSDVDDCLVAQGDLQDVVLSTVELAPNGDLWVGGVCGRIWQRVATSGNWIDHKSQTLADIRSFSFIGSDRAYVAAHGGPGINQVLVRYQAQ